jgi:hypothetical protein
MMIAGEDKTTYVRPQCNHDAPTIVSRYAENDALNFRDFCNHAMDRLSDAVGGPPGSTPLIRSAHNAPALDRKTPTHSGSIGLARRISRSSQ